MQATASLRPWLTHRRMLPKWIGAAVTLGLTAWQLSPWTPLALLIGFAWFFPNEYAVHRWVYHKAAVSKDVRGAAKSHILHHVDPTDLYRIFNAPSFSVTIGVAYLFVAWALTGSLAVAAAFSLGNFLALLYYEYTHFTAHRPGVTPWLPWNRFLKKMHLWHHYKNEHYWFGVTTKRFDQMFRSYPAPDDVAKSPTVRSLVAPEELQAYLERP